MELLDRDGDLMGVIKLLIKDKAAGYDGIKPDVIKSLGNKEVEILKKLLDDV